MQCKVESRVRAGHSCTQPSSWDTLQLWLILLLAELVQSVCQAWLSLEQVTVTALSHSCVTLHQEQHVHTTGWEGCFVVLMCCAGHCMAPAQRGTCLLQTCSQPALLSPFPAVPPPQRKGASLSPDGKAAA